MPVYNVAPYVAKAVNSVLGQFVTDLELIIVDDGSSDGTLDRITRIADPRVRIIRQQNAGSSSARNAGIRLARGKYIAFLDGDDLWRPEKLKKHLALLETHPELDLTFSRSEIIDEAGADTGRASRSAFGTISFEQLLVENLINNGSAVVMRRDALDRAGYFDLKLPSCVDLDVWLRVALLRPGNVFCIDELLTLYRMRKGQITRDWRRMETGWTMVFEKARRLAGPRAEAVAAPAFAKLYRYLGYIAYENRDYPNARQCLAQAFHHSLHTTAADRRTWVLALALCAKAILPDWAYTAFDAMARRVRSKRPFALRSNATLHG
jgi:glycosyltransferase involved in cell wall biosynthesis